MVGLKLRFTFISFGVGWKRGAILRRTAKTKERKKRKRAPFFAVPSIGLVEWWVPRLCRALGFASRYVVSALVSV